MARWTGMYPQPPAALDTPRPASSTAISPAARASRMEACRNRSVPRWHSCHQPSVGRSNRLNSRLGRAVWPTTWVSSLCAGREKRLICQISGPQPPRLSQVCQVGNHPLPGPPAKPACPPQEPKPAHCQQSLVGRWRGGGGTKGFQTLAAPLLY